MSDIKFKVRFSNPKTNCADIVMTMDTEQLRDMLMSMATGSRWIPDGDVSKLELIEEMRLINLDPIDCIHITRITYDEGPL